MFVQSLVLNKRFDFVSKNISNFGNLRHESKLILSVWEYSGFVLWQGEGDRQETGHIINGIK